MRRFDDYLIFKSVTAGPARAANRSRRAPRGRIQHEEDGGTLGWQLLHHIAPYERVVLVDAVAAPPGRVYCFGRSDVPDEIGYGKLSSHEWEVPDLLTAMDLCGDLPEVTIVAIGVDPLGFAGGDVGVRLSPPILERMEALVTVVLREVTRYRGEPHVRRPELRADRPFTAKEIVLAHA